MELDGNPRVIRKSIEFDKNTHMGMWLYLHKIENQYYWFYEDNVDYGCEGALSIKSAINNGREKAEEKKLSFNLVNEKAYRKKKNAI